MYLVIFLQVRTNWKSSRFFFGRNRVIQAALGRTEAEEYREGLSSLAKVWRICSLCMLKPTYSVVLCVNILYRL